MSPATPNLFSTTFSSGLRIIGHFCLISDEYRSLKDIFCLLIVIFNGICMYWLLKNRRLAFRSVDLFYGISLLLCPYMLEVTSTTAISCSSQ